MAGAASNNENERRGEGEMKHIVRPADPDVAKAHSAAEPLSGRVLSRIKLALLDEYKSERERLGYDPYDTSAARARDIWNGKRKRA